MAMTADKLKALPDNPDKSVAVAGKDTLLYVNTGTESAPVWTIVGGQRNAPVKMTANSLDASHKTSGGWASNVPGLKSWSIDYSGLMLMGDDGLQVLEYAFRNDKQVNVKIEYPDKTYQTGWAYITEFDNDNAHDAIATISVTISGNGPISEVQPATAETR